MRIRSIRPEFWSSEDVAALDWHTRLIFIGLWGYVDDNGVGRDSDRLIVADLFPLEAALPETSLRVQGALKALETGGQITRYTVEGKRYLHITRFFPHQVINRPSRGRYPLPTSDNAICEPSIIEDSVSPPANAPIGEGEKGRRGEGEKGRTSISSEVAIATPRPEDTRPEVEEILDRLEVAIAANGAKVPTRGKTARDAVRLMLDRDERTQDQINAAIEYATTDEFWRANILSASKLREKFDQLRLSAQRKQWTPKDRHERNAQFWQQQMAQAVARDEQRGITEPLALEAK